MAAHFGTASKNKDDVVQKFVVLDSESSTEVLQSYDDWACTYDQDMKVAQHFETEICAKLVADILGDEKDASILDAPAGTGIGGKMLHDMGFKNIDALDASAGMLDQARKKNIYRNFIHDFMGSNKLQVENDTYDLVMVVGGLSVNHATEECFPELRRITKPGGKLLLSLFEALDEGEKSAHGVFTDRIEASIKRMEEKGQWRVLQRKRFDSFLYASWPGSVFLLQIL